MSDILIYQKEDGQSEVQLRLEQDTLWLTRAQIAELFNVQVPAISKHVKNIFASGELEPEATISILETVRQEGTRQVKRQLEYYNLDMVISVGYRVNSTQATRFRIWANRVLKDYLLQGYALNRQRLQAQQEHIRQLENTLTLFRQQLIDEAGLSEARGLASVIAGYARAFVLRNPHRRVGKPQGLPTRKPTRQTPRGQISTCAALVRSVRICPPYAATATT